MADRLKPNDEIDVGGSIISQDGRFILQLQSDGNLVVYWKSNGTPLWASNTAGQPAAKAVMQGSDGNFVLYDTNNHGIWASGTGGHPGAIIVMQDDGNLVVYDPSNNALWSSNTAVSAEVMGISRTQIGVYGLSYDGAAISGLAMANGDAIHGESRGTGVAVIGFAMQNGQAVCGVSQGTGTAVNGLATGNGDAVHAESRGTGAAVAGFAIANGDGIHGESRGTGAAVAGFAVGSGPAGFFSGDVKVTGDIVLVNQDCAEEFDLSSSNIIEPGTVMVLNQSGNLEQSNQAYDKKVAGIVSGAGGCKPGIILGRQQSESKRVPIALMGKVYCKVDATSSVEIGDLLTTSPTRGHAMKAEDPFKAFGAVIGKALGSLQQGMGMIPVLVALQ